MKRDTVFFIWIVVAAVFTFLQACPVFAQKNEEGFWPKEIAVEGQGDHVSASTGEA